MAGTPDKFYADKEPEILKPVLSILAAEPLTRNEVLNRGISEEQLSDAIDAGYVVEWDTCIDRPVMYVSGKPSEWKTEKYVHDWVNQHNYEEVVLEVIKNRKRFGGKFKNMLEFLQSFDDGKIKYWDPISFYTTLTNIYNRGELNKFEDLRGILPLVDEARIAPIDQIDIDMVGGKELIELSLLSPVNKELGIYKHGYCNFVENEFSKRNISLNVLTGEKVDINDLGKNQKEFLVKEMNIVDNNGNVTPTGKVIVNALCQCSVDLKDTEKASEILADKWLKAAVGQTDLQMKTRYFLKTAKISKKLVPKEEFEEPKEIKHLSLPTRETRLESIKLEIGEETCSAVNKMLADWIQNPEACPYEKIVADVRYGHRKYSSRTDRFSVANAKDMMESLREIVGLAPVVQTIPLQPHGPRERHENYWKYNSAMESAATLINELDEDSILKFANIIAKIEPPLEHEYSGLQRASRVFARSKADRAKRVIDSTVAKNLCYNIIARKANNAIAKARDTANFILSGGLESDLDSLGGKGFTKGVLANGLNQSRRSTVLTADDVVIPAAEKLGYRASKYGLYVPKSK